ncbi:MAG: S41 family peptidase [Candidatus Saccharibacteria bacterium]
MVKKVKFNLSKKVKKPRLKHIAVFVLIIAVYLVGLNVGEGNIRFSSMNNINKGLSSNIDYSSVNQLYQLLRNNYDGNLTNTQVLDGLKTGLANSTNDPYTEYFSASQTKAFNDELNGSFSGIGAQMGKNSDGQIIIETPIAGFPAEKAGLKAQDIVTEINGTSTTNMLIDVAVNKIRGPINTYVSLSVVRDKSQRLTFKIKRENITVPSVNSKVINNNIGYIQITQFTQDTGDLAAKAAQQLKDKKVKGIVLDLRGNPGGLVDAALKVCNLWLSSGQLIMQDKAGDRVLDSYTADGANNVLNGIPTVILIDGGSASAAEITAGALHDNNVAEIVGVKSFGKGVEQKIFNLSDGAEAKITVAKWYRPNGSNIQHKGITPDKIVTITQSEIANGNDTQLNAATQIIENK